MRNYVPAAGVRMLGVCGKTEHFYLTSANLAIRSNVRSGSIRADLRPLSNIPGLVSVTKENLLTYFGLDQRLTGVLDARVVRVTWHGFRFAGLLIFESIRIVVARVLEKQREAHRSH